MNPGSLHADKKRAKKVSGDDAVLAKIAAMAEHFRAAGECVHALILPSASALQPTVWYGMPGYAKDGQTVCFFRADKKYMTFGFAQRANLAREPGAPLERMESGGYLSALDDATEAKLSAIVRRVAG